MKQKLKDDLIAFLIVIGMIAFLGLAGFLLN